MSGKFSWRRRLSYVCAASSLALIGMWAGSAHAQNEQDDEPSASELEPVIITALRRREVAQDTPIPVNVFNAARVEASGIESIEDLQFAAAGLKVASLSGLSRITLRGVGTNGLSATAEAGVANYLDGVFLGNAYYSSRAYFDLERIEILRGPQGSLYGRNATGGAINVITAAPTDIFSTGAAVTVGGDDLLETEGYVSGPLAFSGLTGRLAWKTTRHDGYTPNSAGKALDTADAKALRGRLNYKPVETFSIDLTADYSRDRGVAATTVQRANLTAPLLLELAGANVPAGRRIAQDGENRNRIDTYGYRAAINWDLGAATLTFIAAYREVSSDGLADFDFTDLSILTGETSIDSNQITEEVYLVSAPGGVFDWTLGGSFFKERTDASIMLDSAGGAFRLTSPNLSTTAYAVYAEGAYHLTDALTVSAGARYTDERKTFNENDVYTGIFAPTSPGPFVVQLGPHRDSWTKLTPHVSVDYKFTKGIMAYAIYSKGFKAGGYNSLSTQTTSFDPEDNTNYEIGVKTNLFENRIRLNANIFRMNYKGLQVQQRVVVAPSPVAVLVIDNAADARIDGVELDFQAHVTHYFSVDANVAYLDTKYLNYNAVDELGSPTGPLVSVVGKRLTGAPERSANIGVQYVLPLQEFGELTLRGEYSYQSEVFNNPTNATALRQKAYNWFNARAAFKSDARHWNVAAWIKNITDEDVYALRAAGPRDAAGGQAVTSYLSPPRTYGLTVGYDF